MKKEILNLNVPSLILIIACLGFTLWASYLVFYAAQADIYAENRMVENIQACLLASAGILYLATAILEKRSDTLIIVFCSLLCFSFFLRELDVEDFDIPHALILIGSGVGRNAVLGMAFAAILIYAILKFSYYKVAAVVFVKSKPGWLLITGGVFLLIGLLFEEKKGLLYHDVFIEEMCEIFGYVLILLSSIAANSFMNGITIHSIGRSKTHP
jgi:hypothetical protein